jgi:hypothetical protein
VPAQAGANLFKIAHMDRPIEPMHKKFGQQKIQIKTKGLELGHHPMFDVGYYPPNTPPPVE